jgi:hypothetical protein
MDGVGSADCVRSCFGEANVADLAFRDQLGQSTDGVFDRGVRVDTVLVVQVDVVCPEAPEGTVDGYGAIRGAAVENSRAAD